MNGHYSSCFDENYLKNYEFDNAFYFEVVVQNLETFEINEIDSLEKWMSSVFYNYISLENILKNNKNIITKNNIMSFIINWNNKTLFRKSLYEKEAECKKAKENLDKCLQILFSHYCGIDTDIILYIFNNTTVPFNEIYFKNIIPIPKGPKIIFDFALKLYLNDKMNIVKDIQKYLLEYNFAYSECLKFILTFEHDGNFKEKFKQYVNIGFLFDYLKMLFSRKKDIRDINKIINFIINMEYDIDNNIFEMIKTEYHNHKSKSKMKNEIIIDNLYKLIKKD